MRKTDNRLIIVTTAMTAGRRRDASTERVCLGLMLALAALAFRIAMVW
jgi:hypothetical protein